VTLIDVKRIALKPIDAARRRWSRAGLRDRVLALVLVVLLVSCGVLFAGTTLALRYFLGSRLDQQVRTASATYSHSVSDHDHDPSAAFDTQGQAPGTIGAHVQDGVVTASGIVQGYGAPAPLSAANEEILAKLQPSSSVQKVKLEGLDEYRVLVSDVGGGEELIVGLPSEQIDDTLRNLALIEGVAFFVVIAATLVVGRRLVYVSLRPLRSLTRTARQVSDLPLHEGEVALHTRVPDPAPGTEIGEVAEAFNHMLDHVSSALGERQRSEEQLRQFVADASHELRTPVAVIRGLSEFSLRDPGAAEESMTRINGEAVRLGALVDNLLLLSRLDAGQQHTDDEVDLSVAVLETVDALRVTAPQHRWDIDLPEEPVVVRGDDEVLRRVITNLVSNATRHTPAGTTVRIALREEGDQVAIVVADNGPGIPQDLLPSIFERFVRGDSARNRKTGSTGLGLAIVRASVQAHGGTIQVRTDATGTEFTATLPRGGSASGDRA
jgi:two-component system OmpR family sensor kinase